MASNLEMERARKQKALGVVPYQGKEPFIFISYAHRDFDKVIPIIKALIDYGFRVWYDEGIDPGTEWDAYIADHVEGCYCMLSFLSRNYLASNNCLDELSYARDLEKKQLFVYLESAKLPGGLALRFGRLQAVHQYTYLQPEAFYDKLFSAAVLEPTLPASMRRKAKPAAGKPEQTPPAQRNSVPATRTSQQQALSALFEFVQNGTAITITALKDKNRTTIEIPKSVTGIAKGAFRNCEKLTSVTIPDSVISIGDAVFSGCTSLTSITIPSSVSYIPNDAFRGCKNLSNITIPNSIVRIGENAFLECSSLSSITIPNSVTSIGVCAFSRCRNIAEFVVSPNNTNYCSADGILYSKSGDTLIAYPSGKWNNSFIVPHKVTRIGDSAFDSCYHLNSIDLPMNLNSIGKGAFANCINLTNIIFHKIPTIERGAFQGCTSLIIRTPRGSYLETYAKQNGIPCEVF